ncbi:MAG: hypothetical protein PHV34_14255 [Verrucomicrobiae bacterium]|nr:hypothetical protein [Verrucomicrobiae bacterium]
MGNINLDDVQPGMVLAGDVKNINGQLLMPSGIKLAERHITMLKAWGTTEVDVAGVSREEVAAKTVEQLDPAMVAKIEVEMGEIFKHTDRTHPLMNELFRLCVLRKAQKAGNAPAATPPPAPASTSAQP